MTGRSASSPPGLPPDADLADVMLPADARLQHHVGGTRGSLNVRIAKQILTAGLSDHAAMSEHLRRQLATAPTLISYGRTATERRRGAGVHPAAPGRRLNVSHSRLLRALRDSGMACEQARFAGLFATAARSDSRDPRPIPAGAGQTRPAPEPGTRLTVVCLQLDCARDLAD